jgi:hypothetical protein
MTDGCGVSNLALHKAIRDQIGLQEIPTAFQCRVAGGKVTVFFVFIVKAFRLTFYCLHSGHVDSGPGLEL